MTHEEILTKVFNRARELGHKAKYPVVIWFRDEDGDGIYEYSGELSYRDYYVLIFSQEFLKAFYGEEEFVTPNYEKMPNWQYHGCQMLLSEDPIQYLSKYI